MDKKIGQIFTPTYLAKQILKFSNYVNVSKKHVIDNSCGDGSFLKLIVEQYINEFLKSSNDKNELKKELELYIHGIEIDYNAYLKCIEILNNITSDYGISNIKWDIKNEDTLFNNEYYGKMDYVIGNPPYVRIHNVKELNKMKSFSFSNYGMTDLYLSFFEIGINMLNKTGKLCYITPNSWFTSKSAKEMRDYILNKNMLYKIADMGHFQPFDNATTYCAVTCLSRENQARFDYYEYNKEFVYKRNLSLYDCYINNKFYFSDSNSLNLLKNITRNSEKSLCVKCGFQTSADKIFIGNLPFDDYTIDVTKSTTGKISKCFYPYDKNGNIIDIEELFKNDKIKNYLLNNKSELLKINRKIDTDKWWAFGRVQAIADVNKQKITICNIIKTTDDLKINQVDSGCGIYGGIYILSKFSVEKIKTVLMTKEFFDYVKLLKNYKDGGYYSFSAKDLECYLNYKLSNHCSGVFKF